MSWILVLIFVVSFIWQPIATGAILTISVIILLLAGLTALGTNTWTNWRNLGTQTR